MHNRKAERADLKRYLLSETSILMLAPRRVGKTWLMERLDQDLTAEGHLCIRFDAAGKKDERDFLRALCRAMEQRQELHKTLIDHATHRLKQFAGGEAGGSLNEIVGRVDPQSFSECLVESLNGADRKTVIMIDEFSLFVLARAQEDPGATKSLLYHLRSLQQRHRNVTWLFTGSVGLDVVARRFELGGALLDLQPFPLSPFTEPEARSYLNDMADSGQLGRRLHIEDDVFSYITRELGWLAPYYLQQFGRALRPAGATREDGRVTVSQTDAEAAFQLLLSHTYRVCFSAWEEHITKNFPAEDTERLLLILDRCCQAHDGETEDTLLSVLGRAFPAFNRRDLKTLLGCLDNDGFLMKDGDRWRFRSGLLRRYWSEYMVE
jgi:hypothetical protein